MRRLLTLVTTVAVGLGFVVTGTANAAPVYYKCAFVSIPFGPPMFAAIAQDCVGPVGSFRQVIFLDTPPAAASYCSTARAYGTAQGRLDVTGQYCQ
ncbi:hypothetical protein [Actinocrispum wychmicini]|uniref:Uncharacterized protein n=1 Tax=Actinocrispum wychmicini TaxID=1213861 RepID=A0A4R2J815_9PSEU|nr:hypothetical protein [Actinocrispum wychmicini]TCO54734.1 hypothetical protein EV192_10822 [Actinocrispum wychmicini]